MQTCTCGDICVNTTGWWRDGGTFNANGTPIQAAVDNATAGETICVGDGTYTENVNVNVAHLTIRSENGSANCTVNAASSGDHIFEVTADYANISGFAATGATVAGEAGIYLNNGADHCKISNNNCSNNHYGIWLNSSSNNTLTSNTVNSNIDYGVYLYSSSNNTLTENTVNSNTYGIILGSSSNNTLTSNTANSNTCYHGICLGSSSNNTLTSNTANSNHHHGIHLDYSYNNTLTENTANSNNDYGIYLWSSRNNTLTENTANSNNDCGICLMYSSNKNTIYNNYFNNTINAYDTGNNVWNTTKTAGTNIIGGSWLGGNYWSDYAGVDTDGDGLGDTLTPYNSGITHGGDYHPLVTPSSVTPTPSGSGGEGTYPPGWFGTPTATVTATKAPAASATTTATDAPPGERVTPAATKAKPAAAKATAPAAEGTTAGAAKKGAPGFTAVFVIAGMLALAYVMMRRRE
jgi:PGF-CTERM protein